MRIEAEGDHRMRIEADRGTLLQAVKLAIRAVEKAPTVPVLRGLLIHAGKGVARVTGTDLEITVTATVPASSSEEEDVVIDAAELRNFLKDAGADSVSIERSAAAGPGAVKVICGQESLEPACFDPESFPETPGMLPAASATTSIRVDAQDFKDGLIAVSSSISNEENRFALNGCLAHKPGDGSALRLVATDGHRLALADMNGAVVMGEGCILPARAARECVRLIGRCEGDVSLMAGENFVTITITDNIQLVTRELTGSFPDYERVLPDEDGPWAAQITLERGNLLKKLKTACKHARAAGPVDHPAVLTARKNGLQLRAGNYTVNLPCRDSTPAGERQFGFNCSKLIDGVAALDSEQVTLRLRECPHASLITHDSPERPGIAFRYVLMPLRI